MLQPIDNANKNALYAKLGHLNEVVSTELPEEFDIHC